MVRRRTRALVELLIAAVGLVVELLLWQRLLENVEEWDDPVHASLPVLAAGALYGGAQLWIRDRDVWGVRTNSYHGIVVAVCRWSIKRRSVPDTREVSANFGIGKMIGMVGYRLWYGLLRPLPGSGT